VTQTTLTIPARVNGPPSSANGGYSAGLVAGLMEAEEVGVSLRLPPPLERPLTVKRDGDRLELLDGDVLVADGEPEQLRLDVPKPVSPDEAAAASAAGRLLWTSKHPFPTCVVCGPDRCPHDGLRVFPGPLDHDLWGAEWTPDDSVDDGSGRVRPEWIWAALDCPTSAPVANFGSGPPMVLARLTARIAASVKVGERHSIISWPLVANGRKRHAAAALYDSSGRLLCASRALWIELRR
jgi:hypothetical protein